MPLTCRDSEEGGDYWAVTNKWVSVTPLGLLQDYALSEAHMSRGRGFVASAAQVVDAAAADARLPAVGMQRLQNTQPTQV